MQGDSPAFDFGHCMASFLPESSHGAAGRADPAGWPRESLGPEDGGRQTVTQMVRAVGLWVPRLAALGAHADLSTGSYIMARSTQITSWKPRRIIGRTRVSPTEKVSPARNRNGPTGRTSRPHSLWTSDSATGPRV